ncbi:MAG: acyl-CoA dehydrogenase family protein [Brevundimonas sp.]|uniref:acyl-CoA dehydrogenase family protein n=1 Tax=Brevundimonas sp. TaxID=1871086 RepID=UPI003919AFA7
MLSRPERTPPLILDETSEASALAAAARDVDGGFPSEAFDALAEAGVTASPPLGAGEMTRLLHLLAAVGRGDLSVGRIFEGHVNTLFLMKTYGTPTQYRLWDREATDGALYGVWNTDLPGAPLRLEAGRLVGRKSFCTGVDGLDRAIVTVNDGPERQMIVVPLQGLAVDRDWWRPMGMRASGSHVVDFTGLEIQPDWMLGGPGDYVRQPWFSAGAMRFAAVHTGGLHAVFDVALEHLRRTGRGGDPYQAHRIAEMGIAVQQAWGWLETAGAAWTRAAASSDLTEGREAIAAANAARCAIERLALDVLETAERSVGAAGLIAPHPLERKIRDLRTYLRQPNPDGALAGLGKAIVEGDWSPGLQAPRE